MVSRSFLMFAFEAIVFIKVFNLFTPIGADLNQSFLERSVFVWFIPKQNGIHYIFRSLFTANFVRHHRISFITS